MVGNKDPRLFFERTYERESNCPSCRGSDKRCYFSKAETCELVNSYPSLSPLGKGRGKGVGKDDHPLSPLLAKEGVGRGDHKMI